MKFKAPYKLISKTLKMRRVSAVSLWLLSKATQNHRQLGVRRRGATASAVSAAAVRGSCGKPGARVFHICFWAKSNSKHSKDILGSTGSSENAEKQALPMVSRGAGISSLGPQDWRECLCHRHVINAGWQSCRIKPRTPLYKQNRTKPVHPMRRFQVSKFSHIHSIGVVCFHKRQISVSIPLDWLELSWPRSTGLFVSFGRIPSSFMDGARFGAEAPGQRGGEGEEPQAPAERGVHISRGGANLRLTSVLVPRSTPRKQHLSWRQNPKPRFGVFSTCPWCWFALPGPGTLRRSTRKVSNS